MPKFSDDPDVQARFNGLNTRLKTQLKKMPEIHLVHDANKPGETRVAPYDVRAYAFLEEYKKDLDADRCLKMLGIQRALYEQWLTEAKFTDVVNRIHKAYEDAILVDAKTIAGWSVEILRDLHKGYKAGDSKSASALASMAGNMLRASGNFKDAAVKQPQVLIQINTSGATTATIPTPTVVKASDKQEPKTIDQTQPNNININIRQNERKNISDLPILRGTQQC